MLRKKYFCLSLSVNGKVKVKSVSCVWLFATPWTVAYQAPLSMGFSGQEYWSGLPFPSPGDLPDPRKEPRSPALQADALNSEPPRKPPSVNGKIISYLIKKLFFLTPFNSTANKLHGQISVLFKIKWIFYSCYNWKK